MVKNVSKNETPLIDNFGDKNKKSACKKPLVVTLTQRLFDLITLIT